MFCLKRAENYFLRLYRVVFCVVLMVTVISGVNAQSPISTYFGGSMWEGSFLASTVTCHQNGNIYIAGATASEDVICTKNAYDSTFNGRSDILIAKFSPDLSQLLGCTYLGGSGVDMIGRDQLIQINSHGHVVLAISTKSTDFPMTTETHDDSQNGGYDIALVVLDSDLTTLMASTFLGGDNYDQANSIAIAANDNIYVSGITRSEAFPTTIGAYDTTYNGTGNQSWGGDLYIAQFTPNLSTLTASTFLGGSDWDYGGHIGLSRSGNVYVAGGTRSTDFPMVAGGYCEMHQGVNNGEGADCFIAALSADLSSLSAATFLGGSLDDWAYSLTVGPASEIFVTGHTSSQNFPIPETSFDNTFNGLNGADVGDDIFVCRFNANLSDLGAATYLGGTYWDAGNRVEITSDQSIMIAAQVSSLDMPVTEGVIQPTYGGGRYHYGGDIYIAKLDSTMTVLEASTYLGGSGQDGIGGFAINPDGLIVIAGITNSDDYPGADKGFCTTYQGGHSNQENGDLCLSIIDLDLLGFPENTPTPAPTSTPDSLWYNLVMPDTELSGGELFLLERNCGNPSSQTLFIDEFIILDIEGFYWFYPNWQSTLDWLSWSLPAENEDSATILTFTWPMNAGVLDGIRFWGAFLEEGTMNLLIYDWIEWGFTQDN